MRARYLLSAATLCVLLLQPAEAPAREAGEAPRRLRARISWGHASRSRTPFRIRLLAREASLVGVRGSGLEAGEISAEPAWETIAGGGDVDGVEATIVYPPRKIEESGQIHAIWKDLIAASDADTARRLLQDPAVRTDGRRLVVAVGCDGAAGFSITVDQLLERRTFWIPSLDIFVDANDPPVSFEEHQRQIAAWKGKRILEQVHARPEASYEEFTALWEDMGSPSYVHPSQPAPGHIVGLTWDSALYKFGIDRGAGVWNDYGNPDRFRFWFGFGDLSRGIRDSWRGQSLADGLPIITTVIEDEGLRFEVEQFAYPLRGPPAERRGDIPMLLLQMVRVSDLRHEARRVSLPLHHRRQFPAGDASPMVHESRGGVILFRESSARRVLFAVQGAGADVSSCETAEDASPRAREGGARWKSFRAAVSIEVPAGGSREILVCLPSPPVAPQDEDALLAIDGAAARAETVRFWTEWIERGAQFRAPEKVVDDLFRASLWHALCLPRRHGGGEEGVRIDLPYSNFAYDQAGTPWPVNQAVYVDYMIHDLRGYHDVSLEELLAIYRNNQDRSGRVRGYANWGVYTPSMVYVAAKHFLLSGDRAAFERILPPALAALDWCLAEIRRSSERSDPTSGLIRSPLNDLTGEGIWAFTQAYVHAALESMGMALERLGHPRAAECRDAARDFRISVERAFGAATARSPLVELRDRTWTPYVPCEATSAGRLLSEWYPTDVDTGATHLLRLGALPAGSPWGDWLLHDHEDNLFWKGWGLANEPVYNPQATAYLLRDEPEAVVRAFYSYLACAFSHSALEPVEHRWTWGQYFGPPSTDGAWFDLYRHMLIREIEDGGLVLCQATPRRWLEDGKRIEVERAPTYFGEISFCVVSSAAAGSISTEVRTPDRLRPERLLVRLRHPRRAQIRAAAVNGEDWNHLDARKEWIIIEKPDAPRYSIVVHY